MYPQQFISQEEYDRNKFASYLWAKHLLERKENWVVLHLAATGLGEDDRIIEICVLSRHGSVMLNTLINSDRAHSIEVMQLTGIKSHHTVTSPHFKDIYPQLRSLLKGKNIISYNSQFNCHKIKYECEQNNLEHINSIWWNLGDIYQDWHNDYFVGKQEYYTPRLFSNGEKHRAKLGALKIYNIIHQLAKPLTCKVEYLPRQFPPKQLFCSWKHWLRLCYYVDGYSNKDLFIKRPYFYWSNLRESEDEDWDLIPF